MSPESVAELYCPACAYDLRGSPGERCPECGLRIDRSADGPSRIPWVHRRHIGRVRAFIRTVALASIRPSKLAAEAARPAPFRDAVAFRRVVAFLAFVPLAGGILWFYWWTRYVRFWVYARPPWPRNWIDFPALPDVPRPRSPFEFGTTGGWIAEAAALASVLLGLWLFLMAATGVASYFCHPRSLAVVQQNRAIALSYYACAPLAVLPLAGVLLALALALEEPPQSAQAGTPAVVSVLRIVAAACAGSAVGLWYWNTPKLVWRATRVGGVARLSVLRVLLPVLWAVLAFLCLVVIPGIVAWLCIVGLTAL